MHLNLLHATGSLDSATYEQLANKYDALGKQLNRFLQAVIEQHIEPYREHNATRISEERVEYEIEGWKLEAGSW